MILSVTFSKAGKNVQDVFGKPVEKIKIKIENSANGTGYFVEMFTKTQVFHQHLNESDLQGFIDLHAGKTFKNCVIRTETEEITKLSNKKGKITEIRKKILQNTAKENSVSSKISSSSQLKILPANRKKNYILQEGVPVPFLVLLGVMNADGKVMNSRYDKFRQINRFLEFIDDILPSVMKIKEKTEKTPQPLKIADFGCGKSYLTFAVHYFLTEIKHIPCQIEGLDLKEDVIRYCNDMALKLGLKDLIFHTGNIADYSGDKAPDIVITLHACDTATDFALKYAVEKGAKAILSVPCCQHQINTQLSKQTGSPAPDFEPLLKWGIIREKFSSLVTDALRGEWLEAQGYNVQMLEFIDMEHTPKNILIRAVKVNEQLKMNNEEVIIPSLLKTLGVEAEIFE